ncbi:predicted protein [Botrytis cinerea T4]|uniref:Uncharacterized protein n=1 Tax=Botryotinia fuckeliana (strain T4) TaxID=999810 RepID=G2Y0I1_BOTF4|nr:predicted protein [Botrytis cinerea T4]
MPPKDSNNLTFARSQIELANVNVNARATRITLVGS